MDNKKWPLKLRPNVIDGDELKEMLTTVFSQMAYYVARTYGPYGENTIYQEGGRMLATKDGWNVEQGIIYSSNILASMIRKMIIDVSTAINTRSGDGTSTGLISANEINNLMIAYKEEEKIHSKLLSAVIRFCVDKVCEELERSAIQVTPDNMAEVIYQVALVSLDWDRELAGFIRDIYEKTGNTVIAVENSGTNNSYVEYRNGYDIAAKLVTDFKVNNIGETRYTVKKPIILLFSYDLNASMFEPLVSAATAISVGMKRELVVIASNFEKDFRDAYTALCISMSRNHKPLPTLVPVRYFAEYNIEREMLVDFCFLTGATNIAKERPIAEEIIREFAEIVKQLPPSQEDFVDDETLSFNEEAYKNAVEKYRARMVQAQNDFLEKIGQHVGQCDMLEVTNKRLIASGFREVEKTPMLEQRIKTIQAEIDKAMKDFSAKSMFTDEIKLKKIRLGKLKLKMGTIFVGGYGEGQLKSTRDALDDAINACANAYTDGVTVGGGIAIPLAIENIRASLRDETSDIFIEAFQFCKDNGATNISPVLKVLTIIQEGFIRTWEIMLRNKYPDGIATDINAEDYCDGPCTMMDIINARKNMGSTEGVTEKVNIAEVIGTITGITQIRDMISNKTTSEGDAVPTLATHPDIKTIIWYCMNNKAPWNLITGKLDKTIIHPVRVETEVIKGCLNLVLVTTTSNQLIYSNYEGIEKELDGMREVKE